MPKDALPEKLTNKQNPDVKPDTPKTDSESFSDQENMEVSEKSNYRFNKEDERGTSQFKSEF